MVKHFDMNLIFNDLHPLTMTIHRAVCGGLDEKNKTFANDNGIASRTYRDKLDMDYSYNKHHF